MTALSLVVQAGSDGSQLGGTTPTCRPDRAEGVFLRLVSGSQNCYSGGQALLGGQRVGFTAKHSRRGSRELASSKPEVTLHLCRCCSGHNPTQRVHHPCACLATPSVSPGVMGRSSPLEEGAESGGQTHPSADSASARPSLCLNLSGARSCLPPSSAESDSPPKVGHPKSCQLARCPWVPDSPPATLIAHDYGLNRKVTLCRVPSMELRTGRDRVEATALTGALGGEVTARVRWGSSWPLVLTSCPQQLPQWRGRVPPPLQSSSH